MSIRDHGGQLEQDEVEQHCHTDEDEAVHELVSERVQPEQTEEQPCVDALRRTLADVVPDVEARRATDVRVVPEAVQRAHVGPVVRGEAESPDVREERERDDDREEDAIPPHDNRPRFGGC